MPGTMKKGTHFSPYNFTRATTCSSSREPGATVKIKNLQSKAGQKLNGRCGVATHFFSESGCWSIELETGTSKLIRIENLEYAMDMVIGDERVATAGTVKGQPGICIHDDPSHPGFNMELIKKKLSRMGISLSKFENAVEVYKRPSP